MFKKAYTLASHYTHPVLISTRFQDGRVESGVGSFVIINKNGWLLTAAHIIGGLRTLHDPSNESISHHSLWWGNDQHIVKRFHVLEGNDLAIGKIENYNPKFQERYPKFMDPSKLEIGTSLCKLGFPFHEVKALFNSDTARFSYDASVFPIPRFPIDGIYTRNASVGESDDGKYEYLYLETSTPGLRGQSGGPIFDTEGNIWAIQSQTRHLSLGFTPSVELNGNKVVENQFLNVGWGIHVKTILQFLTEHNVSYKTCI